MLLGTLAQHIDFRQCDKKIRTAAASIVLCPATNSCHWFMKQCVWNFNLRNCVLRSTAQSIQLNFREWIIRPTDNSVPYDDLITRFLVTVTVCLERSILGLNRIGSLLTDCEIWFYIYAAVCILCFCFVFSVAVSYLKQFRRDWETFTGRKTSKTSFLLTNSLPVFS